MAESVTISTAPPDFKSRQYDLLREEGLKHIQELAGKIWTDYNLSDPGVNILEVMSYVITDLGYRAAYPVEDILAEDPDGPQPDIKNFYTARQILPMNPVTFNDYRKLLIDCEVYNSLTPGCANVGVKNAWIDISPENEIPFYLQRVPETLSYVPEFPATPERINPKVLYNVLLELGRCDEFGDLNENTLERFITLSPCSGGVDPIPPAFIGVTINIHVEFPRWDDPQVDWTDIDSIQKQVKKVLLNFSGIPQTHKLDVYGLKKDKSIYVEFTPAINTVCIDKQLNEAVYLASTAMILTYQQKVNKIHEIIAEVRRSLMANRNLCEDIFKISALKVEEIAICAEIELANNIDVEDTEARIYFEIEKFLAPTVYFRTLQEMYDLGKSTEEIFEGPALSHGFIDNDELERARRRKVIHVSDLISIIMDLPGVIAVKKIQIANVAEDNTDKIPSVSVKWCLDLAFDKGYIPRLSTELSGITYYKELLPYIANEKEVEELLEELRDSDRPQKLINPILDIEAPKGEFKDITSYVSAQDEFPLVYGIGPAGLPTTASNERKAQAKQLKGFLMFFDQLLTDYLTQLNGVKELFSMNGERNGFGDFVIDKTYFSQSLVPDVTDATDLLVDPALYPFNLKKITEGPELFDQRRNRFLDHLMARFSEQFTDYAMIVYRLTGKKAAKELLIDKLEMLNAYPEISSGRFKAFNYQDTCHLWDIGNASGFERRVSLLNGLAYKTASDLHYSPRVAMTGASVFGYQIIDLGIFDSVLVNTADYTFNSMDAWKLGVEKVLVNGINREKYVIKDAIGKIVVPGMTPVAPFTFQLLCGQGDVIGESVYNYINLGQVEEGIEFVMDIIAQEVTTNAESNRNNLFAPVLNYFSMGAFTTQMFPDPPTYKFDFTLYKEPFNFGGSNTQLLTGTYVGRGNCKESVGITSMNIATNTVSIPGNYVDIIKTPNSAFIKGSISNNKNFTILSVGYIAGTPGTTVLTLTDNTLLASADLGNIYFNTQTPAELLAIGEQNQKAALFDVLYNGTHPGNYTFDSLSGSYRFNVADRCGDPLATSVESNFSAQMSLIVANHSGTHKLPITNTQILISGNLPNNGIFPVTTVTAVEDTLVVKVDDSAQILNSTGGGTLKLDGTFSIVSASAVTRSFNISGTYNRVLFPGEKISVTGSGANNGDYTVETVTSSGSSTTITVEESFYVTTGAVGAIYYSKEFVIAKIDPIAPGNANITVKCDAGLYAVKEMVQFINGKFFDHEGFHVVEHILLRPKINENRFVTMVNGRNALIAGASPAGILEYTKAYDVITVQNSTNSFVVSGTIITPDLSPLLVVEIKDSDQNINDGEYKIISVSVVSGDTFIKVFPAIPSSGLSGNGRIYYKRSKTITSIDTAFTLTLPDVDGGTAIPDNYPATLSGSGDVKNNGIFNIYIATDAGSGNVKIQFDKVRTLVRDNFLPLNLDADCEDCRVEDPYSFTASVVLPYWQGRFLNQDFRKFFERALRTECPAHIALNICWVSCGQMEEFEAKFKMWQAENSRQVEDAGKRSSSLNKLIDILGRLRSVYPTGTLHDCESDPELQNSIILNRTAIGTIQL